ncbi:helix-turn-helix domain-containing protein (plasmid) [Borreliella japonica]|uniref:helix-turn-helix domain-containing protein n=1 Tax=Borreliella japonica TaxID=34095 RepID=UPI00342CD93C
MSNNIAYKNRIYANTYQKKISFKSIWMCNILYNKILSYKQDYIMNKNKQNFSINTSKSKE